MNYKQRPLKLLVLALSIIAVVVGCKKDDEPGTTNAVSITSFSPTEGRAGQEVTITGMSFGTAASAAKVFFNDVEGTVISVNDTELVATAADDGSTGPISVSINGFQATSSGDFTYLASPSVSVLSPAAGEPGDEVIISGTNFTDVVTDVTVTFASSDGGVEAEVVSASDTEIVVTVPEGGITGEIMITIETETITGPIFTYPFIGVDEEFETDNGGWVSGNGSTSAVADGALNITFGGSEADLTFGEPVLLDGSAFPILAIKMTRLADFELTLSTSKGFFNAEMNNYDGILFGDTYYWVLTAGAFGDTVTVSTSEKTVLEEIKFAVSKTSGETSFDVEFIRSFENMDVLMDYAALDVGHYVLEFDKNTTEWGEMDMTAFGREAFPQTANVQEDGKLKVTFDPDQFEGTTKRRADLNYVIANTHPRVTDAGPWAEDENADNWRDSWVFHKDYPIYVIKWTAPAELGTMRRDWRTDGDIAIKDGNGAARLVPGTTDVYYWDLLDPETPEGSYIDESLLAADGTTKWGLFTFVIANITSPETGYEVDFFRTFKSLEDVQDFMTHRN